jgi:hypothetical protein
MLNIEFAHCCRSLAGKLDRNEKSLQHRLIFQVKTDDEENEMLEMAANGSNSS